MCGAAWLSKHGAQRSETNELLTLPSPAKLNLFLHITSRRGDGYHCLQTLFQLLDWGDELHFTPNSSGDVTVDMDTLEVPLRDNLIYKAAQLLRSKPDTHYRGVHIEVRKRIPDGGGLGGGSSNAATTLVALNKLWSAGLNTQQLQQLGLSLGADVPVFIGGHSAWAEGVGEQLQPIDLPQRWYLVIDPGCRVPTKEIFCSRQLTRNSCPITIAAFFKGGTRNDCQPVVQALYPEVDNALKWLGNFGDAKLTGTGACIYAGWPEKATAEAVLREVPGHWSCWLTRGINVSPLISAMAEK